MNSLPHKLGALWRPTPRSAYQGRFAATQGPLSQPNALLEPMEAEELAAWERTPRATCSDSHVLALVAGSIPERLSSAVQAACSWIPPARFPC